MNTQSLRIITAAVAAIVTAAILSPSALAQQQIEVQWSELAYVLEGRTVSTVLVDGTALKGRVLDVSPTEARFEIKKTSNRDAYPKGEGPVPRDQLRVLSYTERSGNWRAIGTAIGVGATVLPAAFVCASFQCGEDYSNSDTGVLVAASVVGAGAAIGYGVGHAADTQKTTVIVAKD